jgi:hypothetical protein
MNSVERIELKKRIYELSLFTILKKYKIDTTFVVRYILQKKYQLTPLEQTITLETILKYQPHLKKKEIVESFLDYNTDDDSIPDFDTY